MSLHGLARRRPLSSLNEALDNMSFESYLSKYGFRAAPAADGPEGDAGDGASGAPGADAGDQRRRIADGDRGGRARGREPVELLVPPAPARQVRVRRGGARRQGAAAAVARGAHRVL